MNFGQASGKNRVTKAIHEAMNTPLLFEYDVKKTRKVLIAIYTSRTNEITAIETSEIKEFMKTLDDEIDFIWGAFFDDNLGDEVKITLLATCSDESVVPHEIEIQTANNPNNNIANNGDKTVSLEDLDDETILNHIQTVPAYTRV